MLELVAFCSVVCCLDTVTERGGKPANHWFASSFFFFAFVVLVCLVTCLRCARENCGGYRNNGSKCAPRKELKGHIIHFPKWQLGAPARQSPPSLLVLFLAGTQASVVFPRMCVCVCVCVCACVLGAVICARVRGGIVCVVLLLLLLLLLLLFLCCAREFERELLRGIVQFAGQSPKVMHTVR